MMVTYRLCFKGNYRTIGWSLVPLGRLLSLQAMELLMAKPTPNCPGSKAGQPPQKHVYPAPISSNWPSSASPVSLSKAMSTLHLASSLATRVVPLLGWLVEGLLHKVLTFHEANVIGVGRHLHADLWLRPPVSPCLSLCHLGRDCRLLYYAECLAQWGLAVFWVFKSYWIWIIITVITVY